MTANLQMNYRATLSTTVTSFRAAVLMKNKSLTSITSHLITLASVLIYFVI